MKLHLSQTLSRADRTSKAATRLAGQIDRLTDNILALSADEYAGHGEKLNEIIVTQAAALSIASRKFLSLTAKFDTLKLDSQAAKISADSLADYTADSVLITTQGEGMLSTQYVTWAVHTVRLDPELFALAIQEALTLSGGRRALVKLCEEITRALENNPVN